MLNAKKNISKMLLHKHVRKFLESPNKIPERCCLYLTTLLLGTTKLIPFSPFFNLGLPQNPKVVIFKNISTDSIQSKTF